MRFRLFLTFVTLVISLSSGVTAPKKAHRKAYRTVLDYYRLLPSSYFEGDDRNSDLQKDLHPVIDLKNDYLEISGDGAQAALQVAVFRYRGRDVIAVSADHDESNYSFDLLKYENRRWRNATDDLSPLVSKPHLRFKLPRHGTIIQVYQANGTHLANLYWQDGSFSAESFDPSRHP